MPKVSGGQLLVRALRAQGIDTVFALPGIGILELLDACLDEGVKVIGARHESAAVHMAEGWAQALRHIGVAFVTEGPGFANALPAICKAHADESPVLVISGIAETYLLGKGALQEIPQVETARPVTKWAALVPSASRIAEYVATAFRYLSTGSPGPVYLAAPTDVLEALVDDDELPSSPRPALSRPTHLPAAPASAIAEIIGYLEGAEKPVIVVGAQAYWHGAGRSILAFAETTKIPVFTVDGARGLLSDAHPYGFGYAHPWANKAANGIREADVVLLLGEKVDARYGMGALFHRDAAVLQCYASADAIGRNRRVQVGVVADPATTLAQLLEAACRHSWSERIGWLRRLRGLRSEHRAEQRLLAGAESFPLHPLRVAHDLAALIAEDCMLVLDGAEFPAWLRSFLEVGVPGGMLCTGPFGMIGYGLPYAIGVKAACPDRSVVVCTGDGALGFNVMEFDTAVRHNLPVVVIVGNDGAWGIEVTFQEALYGKDRVIATRLGATRYDQVAQAMGGYGEHVQTAEQLGPAIVRALTCGKPACVDVTIGTVPSPLSDTQARFLQRRRARSRGEEAN